MPLIPMMGGPPPGPGPGGPPPAALLAALMGHGGPPGGPGGPPPGAPPPQKADPLEALQQVIQDLHSLIAALPDPQATQVASQCLAALTRVQAQMMQTQQSAGDSRGKLMQQLGG